VISQTINLEFAVIVALRYFVRFNVAIAALATSTVAMHAVQNVFAAIVARYAQRLCQSNGNCSHLSLVEFHNTARPDFCNAVGMRHEESAIRNLTRSVSHAFYGNSQVKTALSVDA